MKKLLMIKVKRGIKMKIFFLLGCIAGAICCVRAFGAHGLENKISAKMLEVWKTGVTYQMFHAGGLFVVALLMDKVQSSLLTTAGWLMVAGIIMFSGSLYALSTTGIKFFGPITPLGGVAFIVAWILVGTAVVKDYKNKSWHLPAFYVLSISCLLTR